MKTKYSSYQEIDRELEILRVERELHLQRFLRSTQGIKNALSPANILKSGFSSFGSSIGKSTGLKTMLISAAIKFLINRFIKKRR